MVGCYWCRFRKGLECKNAEKRRKNGVEWATAIASSVKDMKNYTFGRRCSEFEKANDIKEKMVFT